MKSYNGVNGKSFYVKWPCLPRTMGRKMCFAQLGHQNVHFAGKLWPPKFIFFLLIISEVALKVSTSWKSQSIHGEWLNSLSRDVNYNLQCIFIYNQFTQQILVMHLLCERLSIERWRVEKSDFLPSGSIRSSKWERDMNQIIR